FPGSKGRGAMGCLPGAESAFVRPPSGAPVLGFAIARPPASTRATAPTINPDIASRLLTRITVSSGVEPSASRRSTALPPFVHRQEAHPARRQRGGPREAPSLAP